MTARRAAFLALALSSPAATLAAQASRCDFSRVPGAVWWGTDDQMTVERLVGYMAPVIWFSPDEPNLHGASGPDIRIPEPFPGESVPARPVLYYQMEQLLTRPEAQGPALERSPDGPGHSIILLRNAAVLIISYYAYYPTEEGLGSHPHDIEPVEFRVAVIPHTWPGLAEWIPGGPQCASPTNVIVVRRVTAKAHGLVWFWNVLQVDQYAQFPMTVLVEEGKHAFATDKNGDGLFTPGYDVNIRINDAWGARDIIRTGMLFGGGYEYWMTKVRRPEHRVLPPLPDDSPLRGALRRRSAPGQNAVYELRPYPPAGAAGDDHALAHLMEPKQVANWPEVLPLHDLRGWGRRLDEGAVLKSLSIAYRYDGDGGIAWSFPFLIVRHVTEPLRGGYILQRMYYAKANDGTHHFGWTALYTPSASRWLDTYLSGGGEDLTTRDSVGTDHHNWAVVMETGLKFRVNIGETPVRFLSHLNDYWGVRLGIRNRGFPNITRLTYVLEIGAGSF